MVRNNYLNSVNNCYHIMIWMFASRLVFNTGVRTEIVGI